MKLRGALPEKKSPQGTRNGRDCEYENLEQDVL